MVARGVGFDTSLKFGETKSHGLVVVFADTSPAISRNTYGVAHECTKLSAEIHRSDGERVVSQNPSPR